MIFNSISKDCREIVEKCCKRVSIWVYNGFPGGLSLWIAVEKFVDIVDKSVDNPENQTYGCG